MEKDEGGGGRGSNCNCSQVQKFKPGAMFVCVCVSFLSFLFCHFFDYCAFWRLSSSAALHEATQLAQKARMTQKKAIKTN